MLLRNVPSTHCVVAVWPKVLVFGVPTAKVRAFLGILPQVQATPKSAKIGKEAIAQQNHATHTRNVSLVHQTPFAVGRPRRKFAWKVTRKGL